MSYRLQQWRQLPPHERWQVLVLMATLPAISLALRVFGYVRTRRWLEHRSRHAAPRVADATDLGLAERYAQLAAIAGRHSVVKTTCLRQALAVHAWLRRRGLRPEFKLGVDKSQARLDAHAWVELEGRRLAQPSPRHSSF